MSDKPQHLYAWKIQSVKSFTEIPDIVYTSTPEIEESSTIYDSNGDVLEVYNADLGFYWRITVNYAGDPCVLTYTQQTGV